MSKSTAPNRWSHLPSAIAIGALLAAVVELGHTIVVLLGNDFEVAPDSESLAQDIFVAWRRAVPLYLALGGVAGLWIWAWLGRFRGSWIIGIAGVVAGLFVEPPRELLEFVRGDSFDLTSTQIAGVAALVLAALVGVLGSAPRAPRRIGLSLLALIGLTLTFLPNGVRQVLRSNPGTLVTSVVCRELILEQPDWDVTLQHPEQGPYAGIITPSRDYRVDGGELPAIIMPPPCEVSFMVDEEFGPLRLNVAAAADATIDAPQKRRAGQKSDYLQEDFDFVFTIRRNGKIVARWHDRGYRSKPTRADRTARSWLRPDPGTNLVFEPGDKVTLSTSVKGVDPKVLKQYEPYAIGFGEATLEKTIKRKRQFASPDRPNLVLIVQDTLRADRCSTYGYDKLTTPTLTRLAERGVRYTTAHSAASWTWPSTASILTGLQPEAHGVTDDAACYLVGRNRTVAEALQDQGFATRAFTCNPLVSVEKNFDQGFEQFTANPKSFVKTDKVLGPVRRWLEDNSRSRFFLYLHLVDPHMPYFPKGDTVEKFGREEPEGFPGMKEAHHEYKRMSLIGGGRGEDGAPRPAIFPEGHIEYMSGLYDASVATSDAYLAQILEILDDLDLTDNTVIAFTSDHGEAWMEHGNLVHGHTVHRELVQVPLVIAGPGIPEGVVSETPVANRHLASTLAAIGGAALESVPDPLNLAVPDEIEERAIFTATTHGSWNWRRGRQPIYGVREGRWALHYAPRGSDYKVPEKKAEPGGQYRLYDLEVDPWEKTDVSDEHPEVAERLRLMLLDNLAEQLTLRQGAVDLGAGAATLDMLDDIGYTIGKEEEEDEDDAQ